MQRLAVPHVSQTIESTVEAINAGPQSLKASRGVLGKMVIRLDSQLLQPCVDGVLPFERVRAKGGRDACAPIGVSPVRIRDHVVDAGIPQHNAMGRMDDHGCEAVSVNDAELLELARDADAVLNCYRPLSADIVEVMKNCRIIARYGIGVDTIPLEVATSRGIQVTNVPDYCIEEVADHGLALILALTRGIIRGLDQTRAGVEREIASTASSPARSDTRAGRVRPDCPGASRPREAGGL